MMWVIVFVWGGGAVVVVFGVGCWSTLLGRARPPVSSPSPSQTRRTSISYLRDTVRRHHKIRAIRWHCLTAALFENLQRCLWPTFVGAIF